jgi:hypothetical protein
MAIAVLGQASHDWPSPHALEIIAPRCTALFRMRQSGEQSGRVGHAPAARRGIISAGRPSRPSGTPAFLRRRVRASGVRRDGATALLSCGEMSRPLISGPPSSSPEACISVLGSTPGCTGGSSQPEASVRADFARAASS